jgi:signal peptidase II
MVVMNIFFEGVIYLVGSVKEHLQGNDVRYNRKMEQTSKPSLTDHLRNYLFLFLIAGIILIIDQISKAIVRSNLALTETWVPWDWLAPYARIVHWKNTGAAFGMLQGFGDVFTILAIIVAVAILYYFPQVPRDDWLLRLAMALQFGGALGNLYDRVTIGWVTDFVSIWIIPVFNVADLCITTGVVLLLLSVWSKERKQQAPPELPASPDSPSEKPANQPNSQG